MAMQKGGMLTIYFSEKDIGVLQKLEEICSKQKVKKNRIVNDAIRAYLAVYDSTQVKKKEPEPVKGNEQKQKGKSIK